MADAKIVDIKGIQWELKDEVARDKIGNVEKQLENLNNKLDGKADKNANLSSLSIKNNFRLAQIIPWSDGIHYRGFDDENNNAYTDIITDNGTAKLVKVINNAMVKSEKLVTEDMLNFVPYTTIEGGFRVVAYSDRTITGNSKIECLENWIKKALSKYGGNLIIIGSIFNGYHIDGIAMVNVWGSSIDGILGASGTVTDQEGFYYYKKVNGTTGSGTLTKII